MIKEISALSAKHESYCMGGKVTRNGSKIQREGYFACVE